MTQVDVSVIIPIYNVQSFISNLLVDLTNQMFQNCEFILIDDGSSDDSYKIIQRFLKEHKDDRFKILKQLNSGVSSARNKGIDIAKGEYIVFIDADDRIDSDFVSGYVETAQRMKADMVFFSVDKVNESGSQIGKIDYTLLASDDLHNVEYIMQKFCELKIWGYPFSFISKRKFWANTRFDTNVKYQEDVLALFHVWSTHPEMQIGINETSHYQYVQQPNSALHTMNTQDYWQFVEVDDKVIQFIIDSQVSDSLVRSLNALKCSSLMAVVAASVVENEMNDYIRAKRIYIKTYLNSKFTFKVRIRRSVQLLLLLGNFKAIIKKTYIKIFNQDTARLG